LDSVGDEPSIRRLETAIEHYRTSMLAESIAFYTNPAVSAKLAVAIQSGFILAGFIFLFFLVYYRRYWKDMEARWLFWRVVPILFGILCIKFAIGFLYKGYIPELLLFYAIPSPKVQGIFWLAFAALIFTAFIRFRERLERFPLQKFLLALCLASIGFSVSVGAVREGLASVAEPYTKIYWEYTGALPEVHPVRSFLQSYTLTRIVPQLAVHSSTHPPGYILILYALQRLFGVDFLGLALSTVIAAGLAVWPIFYLWRQFLSDTETRRALEIFIFVPSLVMTSATSTEAFFLLLVWSAIALCFIGWQRSALLAFVGGLVAAAALFCNFLFLLLAPFFIFLAWYRVHRASVADHSVVLFRILLSLGAFILFFVILQFWSGYSIIDNFFTARVSNQHAVQSNFASLGMYLLYIAMNIVTFFIYLGLPLVAIFYRDWPDTLRKATILFKSGIGVVFIFLAAGAFQGDVERLWLFILPLFVPFANRLFANENQQLFGPFLSLVFLQIIVTQILFYTFY